MLKYITKKFIGMLFMLIIVSIVGFILIQLPPGDYMSYYLAALRESGADASAEMIEALRVQYGLDLPIWQQYFKWMGNVLQGNFGRSFQWNMPVREVLGDRLWITIAISLAAMLFSYVLGVAAGIYSSVHQYGFLDYIITVIVFVGMSVPNFIFTLVIIFMLYSLTGDSMTGLFSPEFVSAPWSMAKFWDMIKHFPVPVFILGISGMASTFRVTRGNMLDELHKTYVTAARARGVSEIKLLLKYPARVAMNPVVTSIGWVFPNIVSGGTIVAIVMSLPTVAPLLVTALKTQDMYLAGIIVVFLSFLTIIGMFVSDLLLMLVDPRVRVKK